MDQKFAIYVRKSKLTDKGNSIQVQIDKCRAHIYSEFDVPSTDKNTDVFIDEGLSGFYADRKEFTRLINSIENYKCLLCYKVDRICRNTGDMMALIEHLDKHGVMFISCSDKISNITSESTLILKLLSVISEFERNIIAERISDNLHELAKEGRWLGGTTPLGFMSQKDVITIRGKKSTKNHLEPVQSELQIVKTIFHMYLNRKSMNAVRDYLNEQGVLTRNGKKHTRISVKNILRNPVYCVADNDSLSYFSEFCETIYADESEFDGEHGLMVYNKTDQKREKKDNSTLLSPQFTQIVEIKPISEWIVAVGQHKGVISGLDWIRVQHLLQQNVDKYDRPKQVSKALLSGLIRCPVCGERMNVKSLSNRYTKSGELRFNYRCRKRMEDRFGCTSKDINGNELDQFIIDTISHMNCPDDRYYARLQNLREELLKAQREEMKEIKSLEIELDKIKLGIAVQTANLRESGLTDEDKQLLWDDIHTLQVNKESVAGRIQKITERFASESYSLEQIKTIRSSIGTFPHLVGIATYEQKMELIKKIVQKIVVIHNDATEDDAVHIVLCGSEDTVNFSFARERSVTCNLSIDCVCYSGLNDTPLVAYDHTGIPLLHFVYTLRTLKDDATIGQRIAFHRRRRKLLGRELAKLAHIGRTTLIRYETDQLECPYDVILRIAKVLDVDKRLLMDDYLKFIDHPYYDFIKQRRKELGLRQIDLGNQIGSNRKTIQKWETQRNVISRDSYQKLKEIHFVP